MPLRLKLGAKQIVERVTEAPRQVPVIGKAADVEVQRQLRQRSRALFALLAAVIVAGDLWLVRTFGHNRLLAAALMLAGALAVAAAYAWLVDRAHVRWALVWGGGVLAALAALDQLLGHFIS
jgi:hypothetical protein